MDNCKRYAPAVLRIGIAILMLWFGLTNIFNPEMLVGYMPDWAISLIPIAPTTFMIFNGIVEVILGAALLVGFFTQISAFIIVLHILIIAIGVGYSDVAIRDYVLAISALSVCLNGSDAWCLDSKK